MRSAYPVVNQLGFRFILIENFQKNLDFIINNQVKLTNQTPFVNMNPLSRNHDIIWTLSRQNLSSGFPT